jgi:aconitase A
VSVLVRRADGIVLSFAAHAAVETALEIELLKAGGILSYILDRALQ